MSFIRNLGFLGELAESAGVQRVEKEAAEEVKDYARRISPVGEADPRSKGTGHYRDAFEVVEEDDTIRLINTDYKAHWIEWGTRRNFPAHAVIRRAVRAAGYELVEKKK